MTKDRYYELMNKAYWNEDDYEDANDCGSLAPDWNEAACDTGLRVTPYNEAVDCSRYITASIDGRWI